MYKLKKGIYENQHNSKSLTVKVFKKKGKSLHNINIYVWSSLNHLNFKNC